MPTPNLTKGEENNLLEKQFYHLSPLLFSL